MTHEPRFLALVAKVDEGLERHKSCVDEWQEGWDKCLEYPIARALKGEIMRHEPDERYSNDPPLCKSCWEEEDTGDWDMCGHGQADWPCKAFLDIEAEVGK